MGFKLSENHTGDFYMISQSWHDQNGRDQINVTDPWVLMHNFDVISEIRLNKCFFCPVLRLRQGKKKTLVQAYFLKLHEIMPQESKNQWNLSDLCYFDDVKLWEIILISDLDHYLLDNGTLKSQKIRTNILIPGSLMCFSRIVNVGYTFKIVHFCCRKRTQTKQTL